MLEHQILATVLQIVSGPGGVASFLMGRNLLREGLNGPSLPLGVGSPSSPFVSVIWFTGANLCAAARRTPARTSPLGTLYRAC